MKRIGGGVVLWLCYLTISAQHTYIVRFHDKSNVEYELLHPEHYLSSAAIERRRREQIPIAVDDIPVNISYISTISSMGGTARYALRWTNQLLCTSPRADFIERVHSLPYVASIEVIGDGIAGSQPNKYATPLSIARDYIPYDSSYYAAAAIQNQMIHADWLHQIGYTGRGVIIAMMDAGFYRASSHFTLASTFDSGRVLYTWDYVGGKADVYDTGWHGLETMSCIAANVPYTMVGTAPDASFLLFHTENESSETIVEEYNWAKAAEVADSLGASVFSTSLGYTTFDASDSIHNHTYSQLNGHTTPIAIASNIASAKGIIVVHAAGNEGDKPWHYISTPADADSAMAIGAVDKSKQIAAFSSWGPSASGQVKPDICARGVAAAVAYPPSQVVTGNSGTSFACPISAGAIACLRGAFPTVSSHAILAAVRQSADRYTQPDAHYGYGIPDMAQAYEILLPQSPFTGHTVPGDVLYPTVLHDGFTLYHYSPVPAEVWIELYDLSGRRVYYSYEADHSLPYQIVIRHDVGDIAAGLYILRVNDRTVGKVIKVE